MRIQIKVHQIPAYLEAFLREGEQKMRIQVNQDYREMSADLAAFLREAAPYIDRSNIIEDRNVNASICRKCGAEIYGDWRTYHPHLILKEGVPRTIKARKEQLEQQYKQEKEACEKIYCTGKLTCPLCGSEAKVNAYRRRDVDEAIKHAYWEISEWWKAEKEANAFAESCNLPAVSTGYGIDVKIKNDPEKLKQYIFRLLQLETNILSLPKRLNSLYQERNINQIFVNRINYMPVFEMMQQDVARYEEAQTAYRDAVAQLNQVKKTPPKSVDIPAPSKPEPPTYGKPGLFNKKKVMAENERLEAEYQQRLQWYEQKSQERLIQIEKQTAQSQKVYQDRLDRAENLVSNCKKQMEECRVDQKNYVPAASVEVCPEKAQQAIIAREIEETENLLRNTYKARNEMYAANVIFGKYRDIVALATFYEYLMAGRCDTLEGPNGAYNLYEAEVRADMIISKLSEIEKSLKSIEKSQYMIYSQLTEMNETLDRIDNTTNSAYTSISKIEANTTDMTNYMERISKNTDVIAHNSTITAYYSKLNAELTDALGFMVALK